LIAYLKSPFKVFVSLEKISFFATNIYFPIGRFCSYFKANARSNLLALFLYTAFPTFLEATNAIFKLFDEIKKATNDFVWHRLLLL